MPPSTRSTRSRSAVGASPAKPSSSPAASKKKNSADAPTAAPPPSKARPAGTSRAKKPVPPASAAAAAIPRKSASAASHAAPSPSSSSSSSRKKTTPFLPLFLLLAAARLFSALTNIVHDCDEVFNYWEPLHFALFGSGMQTWEYSSKFALRPWLYLWLHGAVAAPAAALSRALFPGLVGFGLSKKVAFFAVRAALALASAVAEASLAAAAGDVLGGGGGSAGGATGKKKKTRSSDGGGGGTAAAASGSNVPAVSLILAALLATSAGMFSAAPALLPSSFVMIFLTAAAAGVLRGDRPVAVVAAGVVGLLWGWPVASVAFFPYALWVLVASWKEGNFLKTAAAAAALAALALAPLVLLDRLAYGKWTLSLLNFLRYNVSGDGGDSALYGVEEWHYYLRNALLNLGLAVPLAAAAPAVLGVVSAATRAGVISPPSATAPSSSSVSASPRALKRLALSLLPLPLWSLTISALPHKEERFLYPVYPLACLAAAAAVAAAPAAVAAVVGAASAALLPRQRRRSSARRGGSSSFYSLFSVALQASLVALAALVGASRVAALLASYSAPLRIYSSLPSDPPPGQQQKNNNASLVCLGAEWHRFPSHFLLPGEAYRLAFVAAGFGGLLPVPFDASRGGSRAAPDSLNDRNARDERNELADDAACDYFVGLAPPLGDAPKEGKEGGGGGEEEGGKDGWAERAALPFLDVNAAAVRALPAPARAFYLSRWFAAGVLRRPSWAAEEGLLRQRGRYVLMERLRR